MTTNYQVAISESVEQLATREKALRGEAVATRVQALRLLKTGQATSLARCATQIGYSARQLRRWWQLYTSGGLEALLARHPNPGPRERMNDVAWSGLADEMRAGRIGQLSDAQRYLRETHGIHYTVSGVWSQFQQRGVKLKTGRRRHRQADTEQQAVFKKTSPGLLPHRARRVSSR